MTDDSRFFDLVDLTEWIKTHASIRYQAPLDHSPATLKIRCYAVSLEKPERNQVSVIASDGLRFTFNLFEHLDRFRK